MPEIVYDLRDGEWSVLLPDGTVTSDLVAAHDHNVFVQQAGSGAIALNLAQPAYDIEQEA